MSLQPLRKVMKCLRLLRRSYRQPSSAELCSQPGGEGRLIGARRKTGSSALCQRGCSGPCSGVTRLGWVHPNGNPPSSSLCGIPGNWDQPWGNWDQPWGNWDQPWGNWGPGCCLWHRDGAGFGCAGGAAAPEKTNPCWGNQPGVSKAIIPGGPKLHPTAATEPSS